jgi:outer membrane protein
MRTSGTVVLAMMMLVAVSAFGQQKILTLDEARNGALARNLNVIQAQNNVSAAQSSVLAAYGSYLPTISASGNWTRSQSDRPVSFQTVYVNGIPFSNVPVGGVSASNNFSASASLNFTIFDGLRREGQFSQAKSNATSSEMVSTRTKQSIIYAVESGYLNVLRDKQLVGVNEENLKRDNQQLERIVESNHVGAAAIADVYRQQAQVAADEVALIGVQTVLDKAKADLLALIGLDAGEDYVLADSTIATTITQADLDSTAGRYADLLQLRSRALDARPDVVSAREQLNAASSGVTVARSGYFPSISAFAGYGWNNDQIPGLTQNKNMDWGIGIRWNIFDGFQRELQLETSVAQERNAEINLKQTELGVSVDVRKALLDLESARKGFEASQKGLISATQDQRIAQERYNLGAGTLLDLLTASATLVNAQANQVNATYDYVTAKREVEYALGERTY